MRYSSCRGIEKDMGVSRNLAMVFSKSVRKSRFSPNNYLDWWNLNIGIFNWPNSHYWSHNSAWNEVFNKNFTTNGYIRIRDENIDWMWMGINGPIRYPPRSPDLTALKFYLCGYLVNELYKTIPNNVNELRENLENCIVRVGTQYKYF